jgi:hypothetical protein
MQNTAFDALIASSGNNCANISASERGNPLSEAAGTAAVSLG